jgi:hypothetical protein
LVFVIIRLHHTPCFVSRHSTLSLVPPPPPLSPLITPVHQSHSLVRRVLDLLILMRHAWPACHYSED